MVGPGLGTLWVNKRDREWPWTTFKCSVFPWTVFPFLFLWTFQTTLFKTNLPEEELVLCGLVEAISLYIYGIEAHILFPTLIGVVDVNLLLQNVSVPLHSNLIWRGWMEWKKQTDWKSSGTFQSCMSGKSGSYLPLSCHLDNLPIKQVGCFSLAERNNITRQYHKIYQIPKSVHKLLRI